MVSQSIRRMVTKIIIVKVTNKKDLFVKHLNNEVGDKQFFFFFFLILDLNNNLLKEFENTPTRILSIR